ncbi:DUF4406 domain-containing protein [Rhizobium leguminosarum]
MVYAAKLTADGLNATLHSAILQAWDCALGQKKVIYLSGPITTGRTFVESLRTGKSIHSETLIRKNSESLIQAANNLRTRLDEIVLEPATLHIPGWGQAEYLDLWRECIKKHARIVMFMSDWEYSVGCVTEFSFAKSLGMRTEKIDGTELTSVEAFRLLDTARIGLAPDQQHPRLRPLYQAIEMALLNLAASHDR